MYLIEPQTEYLDLEAQINFPYKDFPNEPTKRKKAQIHTFLFINKPWINNELLS